MIHIVDAESHHNSIVGCFFFACRIFHFHSIEIVVLMAILRQLSIDTTVVEARSKKKFVSIV